MEEANVGDTKQKYVTKNEIYGRTDWAGNKVLSEETING